MTVAIHRSSNVVHVVVYLSCAACRRVDAVVFDHEPSSAEIASARPADMRAMPCVSSTVHTRWLHAGDFWRAA